MSPIVDSTLKNEIGPDYVVREAVLKGQSIELRRDYCEALVRCELLDCELVLADSAGHWRLTIVQLDRCAVRATRTIFDQAFFDASFRNCSFRGKYVGCRFGRASFPPYGEFGGISDCDFGNAVMDLCDFHGCDMKSISLPNWPHYTILNPLEHVDELLAGPWPGELGVRFRVVAALPKGTVAVVCHAPETLKDSKITEGELREALARLPFVNF
jgi:hypothetical protein